MKNSSECWRDFPFPSWRLHAFSNRTSAILFWNIYRRTTRTVLVRVFSNRESTNSAMAALIVSRWEIVSGRCARAFASAAFSGHPEAFYVSRLRWPTVIMMEMRLIDCGEKYPSYEKHDITSFKTSTKSKILPIPHLWHRPTRFLCASIFRYKVKRSAILKLPKLFAGKPIIIIETCYVSNAEVHTVARGAGFGHPTSPEVLRYFQIWTKRPFLVIVRFQLCIFMWIINFDNYSKMWKYCSLS